jgi:hypothetical protein
MNDDEQRAAQIARLMARADRVTHEWLPLSALKIGPYQRVLKRGDVKRMAANFDLDRLDELLVSRRENGDLYLIDGQHRRAALIEMGWGEENAPCKVMHGLTQEDEAWIFEGQGPGMRRNTSRLDQFRSAHVRGDPVVTGLVKTVESAGLRIDWTEGGGRGTVRAVRALADINAASGPDALRRVLLLLQQCYGDESRVFNTEMLHGMAMFLSRYLDHPNFSQAELVRKLSTVGYVVMYQKALAIMGALGHANKPTGIARAMHHYYNYDRRTRGLGEWQDRPRPHPPTKPKPTHAGPSSSGLAIGDAVTHLRFGAGHVVGLRDVPADNGSGPDVEVGVRFPDGNLRRFSLRMSELRHGVGGGPIGQPS